MSDGWMNNLARGLAIGGLAAMLTGLLLGAVHSQDKPVLAIPVPEPKEEPVLPAQSLGGPGGFAGSVAGSGAGSGGFSLPAGSAAGRYQIATWAAGGAYGAFILDTATGAAKLVYSSGKGVGGKGVDKLGKPFQQM